VEDTDMLKPFPLSGFPFSLQIIIGTDASGNVDQWAIDACNADETCMNTYLIPLFYTQMLDRTEDASGDTGQCFADPPASPSLGTWTETVIGAPAPLPEPESLSLFGAALARLGILRRRQRRP
jgi:hypothetical protein